MYLVSTSIDIQISTSIDISIYIYIYIDIWIYIYILLYFPSSLLWYIVHLNIYLHTPLDNNNGHSLPTYILCVHINIFNDGENKETMIRIQFCPITLLTSKRLASS